MINRKKMLVYGIAAVLILSLGTWLTLQQKAKQSDGAVSPSSSPTVSASSVTASSTPAATLTPNASVAPDASGVISVSTPAQLTSAIGIVKPGQTIVLVDGTYSQSSAFNISGKKGTKESPITIKAANQGKAVMDSGAVFNVSNSEYVVIEGFRFINPAKSTAVKLDGSNNIQVTRNTFALAEAKEEGKWIVFQGSNSHHNRIDHNELGPRKNIGQMIAFQGNPMSQYDVIEYNYFHDAAPQPSNGGETIRVGLSGASMTNAFSTIQYNLFVNCDSDPEIISVKSGSNTVRYNTFINNSGQVTARHGHANSYYGNFFFRQNGKSGVGGFRLYGNDQKVYNNYFENISSAIHIDGGDFDAGPEGKNYTSNDLTKHWRIYRAVVVNNTIVNGSSGIFIGKSYTFPPVDSIVANNLVVSTSGPLYMENKTTNTKFEGNVGHGAALSNVKREEAEIRDLDPMLALADGVQKLTSSSQVIDAAVGSYDFVKEDLDGQERSKNDVGADEYSTSPVLRKPLTKADVGPNAK